MFLLIFSAMLVCYVRKRSRRAWESVSYESALMSSEVSQYRPPRAPSQAQSLSLAMCRRESPRVKRECVLSVGTEFRKCSNRKERTNDIAPHGQLLDRVLKFNSGVWPKAQSQLYKRGHIIAWR
ncbi:hypothetical protein P692DRAFT_20465547 [Suillus brevipes Sb2]|nr:hypothetical protein P692DRAFT_20465547 [Suillus brevipes Sb2]